MRTKGTWFVMSVFIHMIAMVLVAGCTSKAASKARWPYENETPQQRNARLAWWREARFGMFIHWGVYAVPAGTHNGNRVGGIGEWIMCHGKIPVADYQKYAAQFNPVKYDPEAWVKLAKEAGMKYIVITSKHHDGFALFDSKVSKWDVVDATPYGKDLLKPLAAACKKHGIKLGFYYSQAQDWCQGGSACSGYWDPAAQNTGMDAYLKNIAVPQVEEILSNYGDIAVLWWDTPCDMTRERAQMFEPVVSQHPGIITNNRLGGGYPGDTETPEQHIPATGYKDRDWETCMTMNDTWGYKSYDENWKSTQTLLRNLIDIASKGGNYLLNVGPTAEGEIPQPSIERLKQVGAWMKVNGESIYGTTASPFAKLPWGRCTKKVTARGTTLYLHVFTWPQDGKLLLPGLKSEVKKAYLLANSAALKTQATEEGVVLTLPAQALDPIATVVVVTLSGELKVEKALLSQAADGTIVLPAIQANIHNFNGSNAQVEEKGGIPNIGFWTASGVTVDWNFKITKPGRFDLVASTACANEKSQFQIRVDNQTLNATVMSTGGYESFVDQNLGQIELKTPGEYLLQIKPDNNAWAPINIRSLTLKPAK
ncbi:alpha-L-fucosidase [Anaerohalosphaeraceae bacterium U12dextr]